MGLDPPCCRHRMWGFKKILQNGWAPGNVIDTKWQGSCSSQTPRYRHPFCRGQNVHDPMVAPRIKEPFCRPPPLQNPSAKAHLSFSQAPHFVERYHFVGINRSSRISTGLHPNQPKLAKTIQIYPDPVLNAPVQQIVRISGSADRCLSKPNAISKTCQCMSVPLCADNYAGHKSLQT